MKFIKPLLLLLLCANLLKAQVSVLAKVDHLVPDGIDTQGNINLTVSGSTAPYTFTWNPGNINTQNINNIGAGSYSLDVLSASAQTYTNVYSLGYKVLWTNLYHADFRNDSLISIETVSGLNAGTCSKNTLGVNTDGWFEYVIDNLGTRNYYIGFADSLSPITHRIANDIDFGIFYSSPGQDIFSYENGTTSALNLNPKIGDVIRVERIGDLIKYKINNATVKTVTVTGISQKVLKIKANLTYNPNSIINVGCSFNKLDSAVFQNYVQVVPTIKHNSGPEINDGKIYLKLKNGIASTYTWTPGGIVSSSITALSNGIYTVTAADSLFDRTNYVFEVGYKALWTNVDHGYANADSLVCKQLTGSTYAYLSAATKNTLAANTDGWFEYVIDKVNNWNYFIGFTDSISNMYENYTDIDYGIDFSGQLKYLYCYENGTATLLYTGPNIGDRVRVERIGNTINYKINGAILRSITNSAIGSKVFKIKANIQGENNSVVNVGCSFSELNGYLFNNYVQTAPVIRHSDGSTVNNGSISLSPRLSGTYSYSWQPSGATANSINGLSVGTYSNTITDNLNNKSSNSYHVAYKAIWTNFQNTVLKNDTLSVVTNTTGLTNYACTKNMLQPNIDGWFEYVIDDVYSKSKYVGFTDSASSNPNITTDIAYGIYYWNQVKYLYYFESGTSGIISFAPMVGDVIRVERIGETINYKINGVLVRTVTNSGIGSKKYKIKANITYGAKVINLGCNFTPCTYSVSASVSQIITCSNPTVTLTGSTDAPAGSTYSWTPGGTDPTLSTTRTSAAGIYTLTVTDLATSCVASNTVAVTTNTTIPNVSAGSSKTITFANPTATLTGSSTTSDVTYSWTPGGITTSSMNVSTAGTYTLKVTNPSNGCTASSTVAVYVVFGIKEVLTQDVNCILNQNGTATVTVLGGTLPLTYKWDGTNSDLNHFENLSNGTHTIEVKDATNAILTQTFSILNCPKWTTQIGSVSVNSKGDITKNGGDDSWENTSLETSEPFALADSAFWIGFQTPDTLSTFMIGFRSVDFDTTAQTTNYKLLIENSVATVVETDNDGFYTKQQLVKVTKDMSFKIQPTKNGIEYYVRQNNNSPYELYYISKLFSNAVMVIEGQLYKTGSKINTVRVSAYGNTTMPTP